MVRTIDVFMIGALLASAAWTFKVKHDSEVALERVAMLENRIRAEREAIDILRADWSLLSSPDRLQALLERHGEELGLRPLEPDQITTVDRLPAKPPEQPEPAFDDTRENAGAAVPDRDTVTGTVKALE